MNDKIYINNSFGKQPTVEDLKDFINRHGLSPKIADEVFFSIYTGSYSSVLIGGYGAVLSIKNFKMLIELEV